jgi:hypothetical protein
MRVERREREVSYGSSITFGTDFCVSISVLSNATKPCSNFSRPIAQQTTVAVHFRRSSYQPVGAGAAKFMGCAPAETST